MSNKTLDVKLGEILYWLFFFSLFFAKGIGLYDGQTIFKIILVFAVVCLGLKLLIEKYTIGEYLRILFVIALTGITYLTSGEKGLLLYGMMMVGMKYVNVRRLLTIGTAVWAGAFFLVTATSFFRMDDTVFKVHEKFGLGHIFRWSLGYPHPNVLHVSYFILAVLIIYALGEKFRLKHALWLFIGNSLVFLYSASYTGFIIFMVLLLGRVYLYARKRLCVFEKGLLMLVFPTCVLLSLLAPIKITGELFNVLNRLLSTRMELGWRYLKPENYTWFGLRVADITTSQLTMDNAYLFGFIAYGIIPFAIFCIGAIYVTFYYLKKDRCVEALIIIAITIGGLTEPFLLNTSFKNIAFVFGGALLFGDAKGKKEFSVAVKWNKFVKLPLGKIDELSVIAKRILAMNKWKLISGMIAGAILCFATHVIASYPEGYVVYQKDCADINEEIKIPYEAECPDYAGYKRMSDFEQGDIIEYFSGNIVQMEKVRNLVISITIGYVVGYLVCAGYFVMKGRTGSISKESSR